MSNLSDQKVIPQRLASIPAFPPIAGRLLGMLSMDDVDINQVADLISTDPTFCGRILQCANSVEFGLRSQVTSIRQALLMLGLDRTREVTLTLATASYMRAALRTERLRRCWKHTVACAIIAEEVAKACWAFADQAYTAGIMHDIGRLGLLVAYPEEYEEIIVKAAERSIDILDYEREWFGVDHAEAGRWLSEKWNLPEQFRLIAGRHHDPPDGAEPDLLTVIYVACRLADLLGFYVTQPLRAYTFDEVVSDLPTDARARLQAGAGQWSERVERRLAAYENGGAEPSQARIAAEEAPDVPSMDCTIEASSGTGPELVAPWRTARFWLLAAVLPAILILAMLFWR